jgi:hypothetical protein
VKPGTLPSPLEEGTRRGSILLAVLVVLVLLSIAGTSYYTWSYAEYRSTRINQRQLQTRLAAESGIEYLRFFLDHNRQWIVDEGGFSHNPARMQIALAEADGGVDLRPSFRIRFTALSPAIDANGDFAGLRYGIENESARLNLNTVLVADARNPEANLGRQVLMSLPGMTETMADSILDWMDEDDDPRDLGAEREYYSGLNPPYEPQNGPFESIDQLLLVRDVTPELLYGFDRNRNFVVDDTEAQATQIANVDNSLGEMNRGWAAYITLKSAELNIRPDGTPRIDLNNEDLTQLQTELRTIFDEEQTNFILAYRQGGAYKIESDGGDDAGGEVGEGSEGGGEGDEGDGGGGRGGGGAEEGMETVKSADSIELDLEQNASVPIDSILDLVGVSTRVVEKGQTRRTVVEAAFPEDPGVLSSVLPLMMENLTASGQQVIPGRININQAPRTLLEGLSNAMPMVFPPEAVQQILANRYFEPGIERPEQLYETWILVDGYVTLDQMKQLMPLITAGGDVYRAQVVGYYEADGPFCRLEAIFDGTSGPMRVASVRDLTPLGAGFTIDQLGVAGVEPTGSP